jgi:hypothetical protein
MMLRCAGAFQATLTIIGRFPAFCPILMPCDPTLYLYWSNSPAGITLVYTTRLVSEVMLDYLSEVRFLYTLSHYTIEWINVYSNPHYREGFLRYHVTTDNVNNKLALNGRLHKMPRATSLTRPIAKRLNRWQRSLQTRWPWRRLDAVTDSDLLGEYTLTLVARAVGGLSRSHLVAVLDGRSDLSFGKGMRLAKVLGLNPDFLAALLEYRRAAQKRPGAAGGEHSSSDRD